MDQRQIGFWEGSTTRQLDVSGSACERLRSAWLVMDRALAVKHKAKRQWEVARRVDYEALALQAAFLNDEIRRVSDLAGEVERRQLALGLGLLAPA